MRHSTVYLENNFQDLHFLDLVTLGEQGASLTVRLVGLGGRGSS